jgi:hypothetical protein
VVARHGPDIGIHSYESRLAVSLLRTGFSQPFVRAARRWHDASQVTDPDAGPRALRERSPQAPADAASVARVRRDRKIPHPLDSVSSLSWSSRRCPRAAPEPLVTQLSIRYALFSDTRPASGTAEPAATKTKRSDAVRVRGSF